MDIIDINKLENVKHGAGYIDARCPMCAAEGRDKTNGGSHLRVWPNGAFTCAKFGSDKDHNRGILQLAGTKGDPNAIVITKTSEEPKITVPKYWDASILGGLIKDHSYWNKRGISNETMDYFRSGVALKGQMQGRHCLPIFDKLDKNKIIGFTGRALRNDVKPKWKHLTGDKSKWIMPAIDEEIKRARKIILVESPGCFLSLFEHGIKNTICLFGLNINSGIMGYLIRMDVDEILVATNNEPDNNNIGLVAAQKIKKQLLQFFNPQRIKIALPYQKDFNLLNHEEILLYKKEYNL